MATKSISKDFTQGNIAKQLFFFALPFMASNALQVLYSTIDMIIVGEFVGTAGLSAVSQSSQIVNFATMVCLGFSNAGQVAPRACLGNCALPALACGLPIRPVLKHGPRSLTCVRANGWKTREAQGS